MRNNIFSTIGISLAITATTFLTGCNASDETPDDNGGGGTISNPITNDATAISTVNGVYSNWQPLSSSFTFVIELNSNKMLSFEGEESEAGPLNSRFEQTADTWYQRKVFNNLFLGISTDNDNIKLVNEAYKAGNLTEAGYKAAIGKAKFLRGLAYLYLVQLWGEVPVFTEEGGSATERQPIDNVYDQIVSDLTDAESLLNDYNGDPVTPSKQAAEALLARAYLAWGDNPLSYEQVQAIAEEQKDPEFTTTPSRLQLAVEYADKVISSGKLALDPDFAKLYGRDY